MRAAALLVLAGCAATAQETSDVRPLHVSVDLNLGETATVELVDGTKAVVKLVALKETVDDVNGAVRRADVKADVDGRPVELVSGTYHLPTRTGRLRVDCPITKGYTAKARQGMPGQASKDNVWGLLKDARLRLWLDGSPYIQPDSFGYPAKQRWFATFTQMANEPVYVDGGDLPGKKEIYYHYGLDIGGPEGLVDVVAATDGLVVVSGNQKLPGHEGTPAATRYDVVYLLDARGWYYRYSHLKWIEARVRPGARVRRGEKLGVLGKEGGSGGWAHLHFDINRRQPSGQWGIEEGFAFLYEAYQREHPTDVVAVARPHSLIWAGQTATLDASRSIGDGLSFDWGFSKEAKVEKRYDVPGSYCEPVKVTDSKGRVDVDFAVVQVLDKAKPDAPPPAIHAAYAPTFGIRPNTPVTFFVRTFRTSKGEETWDFGDGTPPVKVSSDANAEVHAAMGYAQTIHAFKKPGAYIVSVERPGAVARLYVRVE